MSKSFTWRNLLAQIISKPCEHYQLANRLSVHPLTLTRWSSGVSTPRLEVLHRLVAALPDYEEQLRPLLIQDLPEFSRSNAALARKMAEDIPSTLYTDLISLRATTPLEFRCWVIIERLLSALLEQLDAQHVGVMAALAVFTPPVAGKPVRSLHVFTGKILPYHWQQQMGSVYPFLSGSDSLSGYAIQTNRLQSLYDQETSDLPGVRFTALKSAVANPIRSFSQIAGCLYVASQQMDYFLAPQLQLIDAYTQLATLALDEQDFYEHERIALAYFPPGQEQLPFVQAVQYQMTHESGGRSDFPVPCLPHQIERKFWQRVEQQILDRDFAKLPHD